METFAEGFATRVGFELRSQSFGSTSTTSSSSATTSSAPRTLQMIAGTRNLVEPAGAASLAAASNWAIASRGRRSRSSAAAAT